MIRSASFTIAFEQDDMYAEETSMAEFCKQMLWILTSGLSVMNPALADCAATARIMQHPPSVTIKDINPNAGEIKEIKDGNDADGE